MMRKLTLMLAMMASPLVAQDFSATSEAKSWNLYGEVPARFEAKVVDVLCELTGDCAAECGAGARQLGIIRTADNVLVLAMKNSQAAFTGAAQELAPFCNQVVEVDGLMIEDEDVGASNIYLVQRIKPADADWIAANSWTKKWAEKYPEAKGKGPWFRRDPRVKEVIATEGYLGLGPEADATYAEENF